MDNVVVDVRNRPTRRQLEGLGLDPEQDTLLGLFEGVPVTQQLDEAYPKSMIWLLGKAGCRSLAGLREEVALRIATSRQQLGAPFRLERGRPGSVRVATGPASMRMIDRL